MRTRITVEDAFAVTSLVAVRSIQAFRKEVGDWPDLRHASHIEDLVRVLDLPKAERRHPEVSGYDIAYAILRHIIDSAPYEAIPINDESRPALLVLADEVTRATNRCLLGPITRASLRRLRGNTPAQG